MRRQREPRPSREKRRRGHWPGRGGGMPVEEKRVVDHGDSGARGDGVLARSRADRRRAKTNLPHRYAAAARKYCFVSLNYPQKTPPQRERETLAQLRPVDCLHAHRLELRRVRAPHHPQHHVGPDLRLLDERQ